MMTTASVMTMTAAVMMTTAAAMMMTRPRQAMMMTRLQEVAGLLAGGAPCQATVVLGRPATPSV